MRCSTAFAPSSTRPCCRRAAPSAASACAAAIPGPFPRASHHKAQFLANMSHELRTPLNAIIGYTEMMADGLYGDVSEKAQGVLERVQANGRHLLGLINDVLDLSKIEAGQLSLAIEEYSVPDMVGT